MDVLILKISDILEVSVIFPIYVTVCKISQKSFRAFGRYHGLTHPTSPHSHKHHFRYPYVKGHSARRSLIQKYCTQIFFLNRIVTYYSFTNLSFQYPLSPPPIQF